MTHDTSDAGNSTPAQKAMKQTAKTQAEIEVEVEDEDKDSGAAPQRAQDVSKGAKPLPDTRPSGSKTAPG